MAKYSRKDLDNFAAACGLYCGACEARIASGKNDLKQLELMAQRISILTGMSVTAKDMHCEGCQSDIRTLHCRACDIRNCCFSKGFTHCSQCEEFPCQRLKDFNSDAFPHHHEVLKNIQRAREIGINAWLEEQNQRWRCPKCDSNVSWYTEKCPECGAKSPTGFGPSPFGE